MGQNDKLLTEVLMYQGKLLHKEGVNTKGNKWKLWKLNFKKGEKYPWSIKCFDNLPNKSEVKITDLVEGKYYKILYKVNTFNTQYGETKSKQAVLLYEGKKEESTENNFSKKTDQEYKIPQRRVIDEWVSFSEEYNKSVDKDKSNSMHMLGAYIANFFSEEFADLVALCKNNFNKE